MHQAKQDLELPADVRIYYRCQKEFVDKKNTPYIRLMFALKITVAYLPRATKTFSLAITA